MRRRMHALLNDPVFGPRPPVLVGPLRAEVDPDGQILAHDIPQVRLPARLRGLPWEIDDREEGPFRPGRRWPRSTSSWSRSWTMANPAPTIPTDAWSLTWWPSTARGAVHLPHPSGGGNWRGEQTVRPPVANQKGLGGNQTERGPISRRRVMTFLRTASQPRADAMELLVDLAPSPTPGAVAGLRPGAPVRPTTGKRSHGDAPHSSTADLTRIWDPLTSTCGAALLFAAMTRPGPSSSGSTKLRSRLYWRWQGAGHRHEGVLWFRPLAIGSAGLQG